MEPRPDTPGAIGTGVDLVLSAGRRRLIAVAAAGRAAVVLAVMTSACSPSVDNVIAEIDERFGCTEVRQIETLRACDLDDGTVITVDETTSDDVTDLTIGMMKDAGDEGPWVVGDGFLVSVTPDVADLAAEIRELVGGELRF